MGFEGLMISGVVNETLHDYRLFAWQQYGLVCLYEVHAGHASFY